MFIGDQAFWMPILMQIDNLLQLVVAVPNVARGLAALKHANYIFAKAQSFLEIVRYSPSATFQILDWVADQPRPSGGTAQALGECAEFIHSYLAEPGWQQAAQWIVRDLPHHGAPRVAVHTYVTNNGAIKDPTVLHQRFAAIRRAGGNTVVADAGLGAQFTPGEARAILTASQVPRKHTATSDGDAEATARLRDEGTTANSCTTTGTASLERELHRVMVHYRAEIANVPVGQTTGLLELDVTPGEQIWFRNGPAHSATTKVSWRSLEVVIARTPGGLHLVHAQPNARDAKP